MYKKIIATVLSVGLIFSSLANSTSFAQSTSAPISFNSSSSSFKITSIKDAASSAHLLEPYISVGSNGLLHLDEKGKEVVPSETYELVSKGVSILNLTIVSGESTVDTAKRLVVPNFNYSSNIKSAFSNTYWWGVAITMTESEAKDFAYSLEQIKDGFATEAAVAGIIGGIIGGPAAWAASAAGAIVALGAGLISRSITHYNNSKGVTLNLHWLPITYYEVTKNQ